MKEVNRRLLLAPGLGLAILFAGAAASPPQGEKVDYVHDVLPIFKAHCSSCHLDGNDKGGLALDTLAALKKGGDTGAGFVPGQSAKSILLDRILGKGDLPRMPMGFKPLSDKDIEKVKNWIDQGGVESIEGRGVHWAFVVPKRPALPLKTANPIDSFVFARLKKEGIKPSPEADRITLIRRVTLDLTGLPPAPEEVDAFLKDMSTNAFEKVVDRLLANPHYGERMALPWLDAARYADSNGFQQDGDTFQYVWRDWVIRAMNANMPFDRFTREQLAGDLLQKATLDQLIATGFNRNHMLNGEGGAIPEEQRSVNLFDRVDTTSTTWLGLTMACARCHDHKYDPLSQRDYYAMMAYFNNVPESGVPTGGGQYRIADPWVYAGSSEEMSQLESLPKDLQTARDKAKPFEEGPAVDVAQKTWESNPGTVPDDVRDILKLAADKRNKDQAARLRQHFLDTALASPGKELRAEWKVIEQKLNELRGRVPRVMVMSDAKPRKTNVFIRGNYESLGDEVKPAVPEFFPASAEQKNRADLADWILSPKNPLTARVQVNRQWQTFFGRGLVKTPENFGVQSERPVHPELLDWLAVEFRESGWNVKRLQKLIVMSQTYRQSSKVSKTLYAKDPSNFMLARGARFRMPSLLLRDLALASSGLINPQMYGKPVYPYQPKGIWDGLNITLERNFDYPQSKGADNYRRSIYTFWRRTVAPGNMFDASARNICTVSQGQTSTPLHALTMLNDVTWVEAGRALAQRVMELPSPEVRLARAFRLVCARSPRKDEMAVLKRSLDRALLAFRNDPDSTRAYLDQGDMKVIATPELAAYATVCQAILNLDEAMTRE